MEFVRLAVELPAFPAANDFPFSDMDHGVRPRIDFHLKQPAQNSDSR
jgi:hypothetical protein